MIFLFLCYNRTNAEKKADFEAFEATVDILFCQRIKRKSKKYKGMVKQMKVEHIGVAVQNLEKAVAFCKALFPEAEYVEEPVADGSMKMMIVKAENLKLELMEPLKADSPVGKFIARRGEGLHHIAYEVADIAESMAKAQATGIRLLTEAPYTGTEGCLVCFMHPKDTFGMLSEFCQCPSES